MYKGLGEGEGVHYSRVHKWVSKRPKRPYQRVTSLREDCNRRLGDDWFGKRNFQAWFESANRPRGFDCLGVGYGGVNKALCMGHPFRILLPSNFGEMSALADHWVMVNLKPEYSTQTLFERVTARCAGITHSQLEGSKLLLASIRLMVEPFFQEGAMSATKIFRSCHLSQTDARPPDLRIIPYQMR